MFFSKSSTNCSPLLSYASFKFVITFKVLTPSVKGTTIFSNLLLGLSKTSLITGNAILALSAVFFI